MEERKCEDCGDRLEVGNPGPYCFGCRIVRQYVTADYQRREGYAPVCPVCGGPLAAQPGKTWLCLWCASTPAAPMYDHRNATARPPLGCAFLDYRMEIATAMARKGTI